MEVLNLKDQDTLRRLVEGSNSSEIFISEFQRENGDSDIEEEEVEFVPTQSRYVQSALRQPLEINEIDDELLMYQPQLHGEKEQLPPTNSSSLELVDCK